MRLATPSGCAAAAHRHRSAATWATFGFHADRPMSKSSRSSIRTLVAHAVRGIANREIHHLDTRTTKSGAGGANPAVTAYSELPNSARVVGTLVAGLDVNGSVMYRVMSPET